LDFLELKMICRLYAYHIHDHFSISSHLVTKLGKFTSLLYEVYIIFNI